jgi:hypothetical protein
VSVPSIDAWWTRSPSDSASDAADVVVDVVDVVETTEAAAPEGASAAPDAAEAPESPPEVVVGFGETVALSRRRLRQIRQIRQLREAPRRTSRRSARPTRRPTRPAGRRPAVLAAVAAALALGSAATGGVLALRPDPAASAPVAVATRVVPVDRAAVRATASSTQSPDGDITYAAANTLDGDVTTAWNSNGKKDGNGPGIALTYTFTTPVSLRDVTIRNGYQKVRPRPGRTALDLYPLNARVHRVRVVTDAGAWVWDLADTRSAQTFPRAAGRTGWVRLEIVSVHPSSTYPDVALSEVAFTAAVPR